MRFAGPFPALLHRQSVLPLILYITLIGSACAVVYCKHLSRTMYAQIQDNAKQRATLNAEWTQLVLERGAWTSDMRVEEVAKEQLQMIVPKQTGVIQP